MTDELDKLAREIVKAQHLGVGKVALVRLGLEDGMKMQRERDAAIADDFAAARPLVEGRPNEIVRGRYEGEQNACRVIAQAIRAST